MKSTKSAVDTAQKSLTDVQTTIASLTEELAKPEQEHEEIEEQIEASSLVADIDRKAELEELVSHRDAHLEDRALSSTPHPSRARRTRCRQGRWPRREP